MYKSSSILWFESVALSHMSKFVSISNIKYLNSFHNFPNHSKSHCPYNIYNNQMAIPSRELAYYTTLRKGSSSSRAPWEKDTLFPQEGMWATFKKNTVDNQENRHSEYKLPHIREIELDLIRRRPWKVHLSKNWLQHMSPCFFSHSLPTALHSIHVCCLIHLHLLTFGLYWLLSHL